MSRIINAIVIFFAAAQASASVRMHRQPSDRTLDVLGIDRNAMRAIQL